MPNSIKRVRRPLSDKLFWLQALDLLGLPAPANLTLPAITRCPICEKGRLHILADRVLGGQWHWCQGCHTCGDMVELAAKSWSLDIPATIAKLSDRGVDDLPTDSDEIDGYLRVYYIPRQKTNAYWAQARENNVLRSKESVSLVRKLKNWSRMKDYDRWKDGPGQMYGISTADEAVAAVLPPATSIAEMNELVESSHRIFKPGPDRKRWGDVLAIPHYDMPGRICAFLFIGRDGDPEHDWEFVRAFRATLARQPGGSRANVAAKEGGLSWHPQTIDIAGRYNNRVLVLDSVEQAIGLQSLHSERSTRPLPIASWRSDKKAKPAECWRSLLLDKRPVFWADPAFTPELLRNAMISGGRIFRTAIDQRQLGRDRPHSESAPEARVRFVLQKAKPWPVALEKYWATLTDGQLEEFLMNLRLLKIDLSEILRRLRSKEARARMERVLSSESVGKTAYLKKRVVLERDQGWYAAGAEPGAFELIMDAVFRIDAVIYQARTKSQYYQGRLIFQGHTIDFCDPAETIQSVTHRYLENLVLASGKGVLYIDRGWNSRLLELAKLFHKPKLVQGVDTVGWDADNLAFVFPKFRIEYGGEVQVNKQDVLPSGMPCERMPLPRLPSRNEFVQLTRQGVPQSATTFAVLTAILANLLAPVFNERSSGIILHGMTAEDVGRDAAEAAGCAITSAAGKSVLDLLELEAAHDWPIFVDYDLGQLKQVNEWICADRMSRSPHNCIITANWYTARTRQLYGGWTVIENHSPVRRLSSNQKEIVGQIIPAYLRNLCQRNLQWTSNTPAERWFTRVLEDLIHFIRSDDQTTVSRSAVSTVMAITRPDKERGYSEAFAELTSELFRTGQLRWSHRKLSAVKTSQPTSAYRADKGVAIPKEGLRQLMRNNRSPIKTFGEISRMLRDDKVLEEDAETFWIVSEKWWQKIAKEEEAAEAQLLRVV